MSGKRASLKAAGALLAVSGGLLAVCLVRALVADVYEVPTASMEPTVEAGSLVVAEKVTYLLRDPEPGDVVVLEDPEEAGRFLLKRVVAVPGETVTVADGRLAVDGRTATFQSEVGETLAAAAPRWDADYPYTLKEGEYFVLGDNREDSSDSRAFGPVERGSIVARTVPLP